MDLEPRSPVRIILYVLLVLYAAITLGPFVWSVSTSLARTPDVPNLLQTYLVPPEPTLDNYGYIVSTGRFPRWVLNSVIVAGSTLVLKVLFDSACGYALARIDFRGRNLVFWTVMSTMMVPAVVLLVPQYLILNRLGWLNTYQGLIVPFSAHAFGIFLMRQFFLNQPRELEEAARVDGLGRWGIFWKIAMPLARPALAALAIFSFIGDWNAFMWPNMIARSADMFTLPVGLQFFKTEHYSFWNIVMAGSMFMTLPAILFFVAFQRWFVKGISLSGLKG